MADKFLNTGGGGNANISNGSANIFAAVLGADNLEPSKPIKTNSVKQLISTNLEVSDINNLQNELDNVLTNPFNGTLQATDFKGNSIKDITETTTINLTPTEIDLVATSVKVNGQTVDPFVDLQDAYNNSTTGDTQLAISKPYTIKATDTTDLLTIDGDGKIVNAVGLQKSGDDVATEIYVNNAISNIPPVDLTDLNTKTQNINLATTTAGTTDITGLVKVDGLSSNSSLIIFSPSNLTIDATGDIIINSVMGSNSFIIYRSPFVDYLNPTSVASLAAVGYVNQEILPVSNKTQNISTLTVAGNTKYSGQQTFYMGALGSADVFSINTGVPSDTLVSRIFDTAGGTVNTTATLNTTNIIPSVADTWDIGTVSNRYENVYLRNLFTFGIEMSGTSINGINSGFSLGYQGVANVRVNPTETAFEKDVNITAGNLAVVSGNVNVPSGTLFVAGSTVPLNLIWDNSIPDATYTNARKTLNIDTNIATYRAFVSTNPIFKYSGNGSFSLKTSAGSTSPVYVGFIKGPPPSSGVAGFYGQLNGGAFIDNGIGIGGANAWTTNTTLTFTIQNGQWKIESTEFVGGTFRPLINDNSDYYICVICDANGLSNPLSIEITASTFSGLSPQAIIADGDVNVINGNINCGNQVIATPTTRGTFDASNDVTFYSDNYVSIKWNGAGKQPQFSVNPNYDGYWDVSYEVIKNDDAIYANQDILTSVNNDYFFTGGTVINTTYSAVNFSTRFNCFLHKESGSNAPSYDIVVKSGNVNQFAAYMVNIIKPDGVIFVGTERTTPSPAPALRVSNKSRIIQMEGQILSLLNRLNELTNS